MLKHWKWETSVLHFHQWKVNPVRNSKKKNRGYKAIRPNRIYRTFTLNTKQYTFYSGPHGTFFQNCLHKISQSKYQQVQENWNNFLHPIRSLWIKVGYQKQQKAYRLITLCWVKKYGSRQIERNYRLFRIQWKWIYSILKYMGHNEDWSKRKSGESVKTCTASNWEIW